jgi:hypothetical protein
MAKKNWIHADLIQKLHETVLGGSCCPLKIGVGHVENLFKIEFITVWNYSEENRA